jgi:acyl carrier protein
MDTKQRLTNCFHVVFPDLPEAGIPLANQSNTKDWDSVAAITLVNVIEEEFSIELDLDSVADLDSFDAIEHYLTSLSASR